MSGCPAPPGVEALTRFPSDDGRSPEHWFSDAASVGLGEHLEFAALEAALLRTAKLPEHLYVAVNLSPDTCLNPRLPVPLERSGLAAHRIVLELTERLPVAECMPLLYALAPCGAGAGRLPWTTPAPALINAPHPPAPARHY